MNTGIVEKIRMYRRKRAISEGKLVDGGSLISLNPWIMRLIDGERCVDIYVEQSSREFMIDSDSISCWHGQVWATWRSVLEQQIEGEPIAPEERAKIVDRVVQSLRVRYPKASVIVRHAAQANSGSGGQVGLSE